MQRTSLITQCIVLRKLANEVSVQAVSDLNPKMQVFQETQTLA